MFRQLVASRPDPAGPELKRGSAVSLLAHGLVVAGALWATVRPQATAPAAARVVITWPDNPITPAPDGLQLPAPSGDFGPVPVSLPPDLPSVGTRLPLDPRIWLTTTGDGARITVPPSGSGDPWTGAQVDEPPALLAGRSPRYPEALRAAGMAGRVIVQAVIDTTGRAEPGSVIVVESPDSGFDEPARTYVLTAQFRPGRVRGRPVRVLVRVPIEFALSRSR